MFLSSRLVYSAPLFYSAPLLFLAVLSLSGCGGSSSSLTTATPITVTTPVTPPVTTPTPVVPVTAAHYAVASVGLLPGFSYGSGTAINSQGQITGFCEQGSTTSPITHAFLCSNGVSQDLGTPSGYTRSTGAGIDDAGDVAVNGTNIDLSGGSAPAIDHPFLVHNGAYSSIATPPGNLAHAVISSKGNIGGVSQAAFDQAAPFLSRGGAARSLGVPPGYAFCDAAAINNHDDVVGTADSSADSSNNVSHATLYHAGAWTDLGTLAGLGAGTAISQAGGLNDLDQVTGSSGTETSVHAFLYSQGKMQDLGVLPGYSFSRGDAVNNQTIVVGTCYGASGSTLPHAFICAKGQMQDLNTLLPKNSGWVLQSANAINSAGQITGDGLYKGQDQAFLLTPSS